MPVVLIVAVTLAGVVTNIPGLLEILGLRGVSIPLIAVPFFVYLTGMYLYRPIKTFI